MSPRTGFDRFMVDVDAASNPKVKRLRRAGAEVRWTWFHGVLPIAAQAPMRGSLTIGTLVADEQDIADKADVTLAQARKTVAVARELGMLDRDEDGIEWVHDFDDWNPEPKADGTASERSRRYRERQRARRDASRPSRRDGRDETVTSRREVEGEVEELHPPNPPPPAGGTFPTRPSGGRARQARQFEEQAAAFVAAHFPGCLPSRVGAVAVEARRRGLDPPPDALRHIADGHQFLSEYLQPEGAAA